MANVPFFFDGQRKVIFGSATNRTTALAVENPGARYQEIGGSLYESDGSEWNQISSGGAPLVNAPAGVIVDENGVKRTVTRTILNPNAVGDSIVVAAQTGLRVRVVGAAFSSAAAVVLHFRSGTNPISGNFNLAANGGDNLPNMPHGWFQTAVGEALNINLSGAVAVGVTLLWYPTT